MTLIAPGGIQTRRAPVGDDAEPRVDPGELDTRDWAKWHAEHPYLRHPRAKKLLAKLHAEKPMDHSGGKFAAKDAEVMRNGAQTASRMKPGKVIKHGPVSDADYRAHRDHVERALTMYGSKDLEHSPFSTHNSEDRVNGDKGRYTEERRALHDRIIGEYMDRAATVPREHKGIIMGGLGGAGKSTILKQDTISKHLGLERDEKGDISNFLTINPDDIKERMAELGAIPKVNELSPMEASVFAHEEASELAKEVTRRVVPQGTNVIHDITLNSAKSGADRIMGNHEKRIEGLKAHGYKVAGVMVDVSTEHSLKSAEQRHRGGIMKATKGEGYGGRYVPSDLIRTAKDPSGKYRSVNTAAFHTLKEQGLFDHTIEVDNEGYAGRITSEGGTPLSAVPVGARSDAIIVRASLDQTPIEKKIEQYGAGEIPWTELRDYLWNYSYENPPEREDPGFNGAEHDDRTFMPGTFGEVRGAYADGKLTSAEYNEIANGPPQQRRIAPGSIDTRDWAEFDAERRTLIGHKGGHTYHLRLQIKGGKHHAVVERHYDADPNSVPQILKEHDVEGPGEGAEFAKHVFDMDQPKPPRVMSTPREPHAAIHYATMGPGPGGLPPLGMGHVHGPSGSASKPGKIRYKVKLGSTAINRVPVLRSDGSADVDPKVSKRSAAFSGLTTEGQRDWKTWDEEHPWVKKGRRPPGAVPFGQSHHASVKALADASERYAAERGIEHPTPERDYSTVMADPVRGRQIADLYAGLPVDDPQAHAAYRQLADEVRQQHHYLTHDLGVTVEVVDHDPYANAEEMVRDVGQNHHLAVLSTKSTGPHPFLSNEENDQFRAVHDAFGHAATGRGFDRNGEEAAWAKHSRMFSPLARRAMTTETRGQNSAMVWRLGTFPEQKVALLPEEFALRIAQLAAEGSADADNHYDQGHVHHTSLGRWPRGTRGAELGQRDWAEWDAEHRANGHRIGQRLAHAMENEGKSASYIHKKATVMKRRHQMTQAWHEGVAAGMHEYARHMEKHPDWPMERNWAEWDAAHRVGPRPDFDAWHAEHGGKGEYDEFRQKDQAWKRQIRHGLAMGHITPAEAQAHGYISVSHESVRGWEPLPPHLYHVTTNHGAIVASGKLKSRDELGMGSGHGLGGGESHTISFTDDLETARTIKNAMLEARQVARGEITPADLLERARKGDKGSTPFLQDLVRGWHSQWNEGEEMPQGIQALLAGKKLKQGGLLDTAEGFREKHGKEWEPAPWSDGIDTQKGKVYTHFWRDATPQEKAEDATHLYKGFSLWRSVHGGPEDPLFFTNDAQALADTKAEDIQIVHAKPKPGAMGYQVSALGEWRSPTGDNVEVQPETVRSGVLDLRKASGYSLSPGSGMVSLDIAPGVLPRVPGGVDDHHITIVYLGKDVSDELLGQVSEIAQAVAARTAPLSGTLGGLGTFESSEASDGKVPVYVKPDIPGIETLRPPFEQFNASQHKDFKPHATLAYVEPGDALPEPVPETPVTFTHLTVHRGEDVLHFPLTGHRALGDLEVRDWAKWNEEHRPFGRGHYQKAGDREAEEAWSRGHHEVIRDHQFHQANHKLVGAISDTQHRRSARKEAAKSFAASAKRGKSKRERQLLQAYHEGRAHAHHDMANQTHIEIKGVAGLAGALRVEGDVLDVRDWTAWDEAHKVMRKPRKIQVGEYEHRGWNIKNVPGRGWHVTPPGDVHPSDVHRTKADAVAAINAFEGAKGTLPKHPWVDPPDPTGESGRKAGGFTAVGITNTALGDAVENALIAHFGMSNEHPGRRQGPLDVVIGKNGYEVKAVSTSSTEYKAKPKKSEVESKVAYAAEHGLDPHTMVVVYSPAERQLYVYSKPGIGAYRLTNPENGWTFHGTVPLDLGENPDPAAVREAVELVLRNWEKWDEEHEVLDYHGQHAAPRPAYGDPMHDIGSNVMPKDYVDHPEWYGTGDKKPDAESFAAMRKARGNGEARITIHRAVPKHVTEINPGDWVTPSKTYAEQHAASGWGGEEGHVISKDVAAKELWTNGDSPNEWGWHPQSTRDWTEWDLEHRPLHKARQHIAENAKRFHDAGGYIEALNGREHGDQLQHIDRVELVELRKALVAANDGKPLSERAEKGFRLAHIAAASGRTNPSATIHIARTKEGHIAAIAASGRRGSLQWESHHLALMGSTGIAHGAGSALLQRVMVAARLKHKRVTLVPYDEDAARHWAGNLGAHEDSMSGDMGWTADEVKELAAA